MGVMSFSEHDILHSVDGLPYLLVPINSAAQQLQILHFNQRAMFQFPYDRYMRTPI